MESETRDQVKTTMHVHANTNIDALAKFHIWKRGNDDFRIFVQETAHKSHMP